MGCHPVAVVYFTCTQKYEKNVNRKFKSGGLHEKHVVETALFKDPVCTEL